MCSFSIVLQFHLLKLIDQETISLEINHCDCFLYVSVNCVQIYVDRSIVISRLFSFIDIISILWHITHTAYSIVCTVDVEGCGGD